MAGMSTTEPGLPEWFRQPWRHCCLRLVVAGCERFVRTRRVQRRICDHWVLWHLRRGRLRSVGPAGALACTGGDSWLSPPSTAAWQEISAGSELWCANFDVLPAPGWTDPLAWLILPAVVADDGGAEPWQALGAGFDRWTPRDDDSVLRCRPALDAVLFRHLRRGFAAGAFDRTGGAVQAPAWVADLAAWVGRRAIDPGLQPAGIVHQAGYSARHVRAAFQRHFGCTPGGFLRQRRLAIAQRLLRERRDEAIASIARRCGWRDPGLFARQFRAAFGRSPRAWRRGDAPGPDG
jgi:AraC-like DNA-binding protein